MASTPRQTTISSGRFVADSSWILALALVVTLPSPGGASDGIVALQTAHPSCADDSDNTYVDCGNGTVTDNRTGLVWLKDATCYGDLSWHEAMEVVAGFSDIPDGSAVSGDDCGLSDGSSPGEWRLPSIAEWEVMVAHGLGLGCDPSITDDQGDGCWATTLECFLQGRNCSFEDVQSSAYWSSSTTSFSPNLAWEMLLDSGSVSNTFKTASKHLWPVRGGQ